MLNETPTGRALQKETTRKAVLEAAKEEFERVGFDAANVRTIAARAGVSVGTVMHHAGEKRDLLHAALFDDLEATLSKVLAELGEGPLEAQLGRLTRGMFRYYQRRPELSRALLKESLFAEGPWARRFTAQVGQTHGAVARLVASAVERGELTPGTDGPLLAVAWFSFFYFSLIGWVQGANGSPVTLVEKLVTQHLAGLRPAKKRSIR